MSSRIAMSDLGAEYDRLFGEPAERGVGRTRKCKVCGGWHSLSAWPHNCRPEAPPRANLAAPRVAPRFEAFVAGDSANPVVINDPRDKRNYMDRHDLVEFDAGIEAPPQETKKEWMAGFVEDLNRAEQEDPLSRPPVEVIGRTDLEGAAEINTDTIEVAK